MTLPRTPSQTVGPFYTIGLCRRRENELVPPDDRTALRLFGRLLDGAGDPVDGMVELWDAANERWGRCGTDDHGRFEFIVAKPARANGEAPRLDVYVFARGLLKHQLTRVYFPDERDANAADPVLSSLAADEGARLVAEREDGALRFDVRLQGEHATVFFDV